MLNPILFTDRAVQTFLRHPLTAYRFAGEGLYVRKLIGGSAEEDHKVIKGTMETGGPGIGQGLFAPKQTAYAR